MNRFLEDFPGSSLMTETMDPPKQPNTTKIGVIHTAPTPMLGLTNPNGNTDTNTVFSQTAKSTNLHLWYYFGWIRDSAGTGFISLEFQHNPIDAGCVVQSSGAVDYSLSTCNPSKGREGGTGANADFVILWDQSGNSTQIIKRNFVCSNGAAKCTGSLVLPAPCPNVITSQNPADACHVIDPADAIASFGLPAPSKQVDNDSSRGELAIDLTTQVFSGTSCQSFANVIPGTVTGNSDQADYKDVVLSAFPPISNCGTVTITKATEPAGLAGTFTYTLAAAGALIFNADGVDSDCLVSGSADTVQCRGTLTTSKTTPTDTDTISDLRENDTTWTLGEDSPGPDFELKSIDCVDSQSVSYHLFGEGTTVSAFRVEAGGITACRIVNKIVKANPNKGTSQTGTAAIKDLTSLSGIKPGAADAADATATFKLYSANSCLDPVNGVGGNRVYISDPITLTYGNNGTTASAAMTAFQTIVPGITYYWRVTYSGDAFNNSFTTDCSSESASVHFTFIE